MADLSNELRRVAEQRPVQEGQRPQQAVPDRCAPAVSHVTQARSWFIQEADRGQLEAPERRKHDLRNDPRGSGDLLFNVKPTTVTA